MSSVDGPLTPRGEAYRERVLGGLRATVVPVDPPRFWDLMQTLGWGRTLQDAPALAAVLQQRLALAECLAAEARFRDLERQLERALAAWELQAQQRLGLGGDLARDLRQHVIGLGRADYETALRNPAVLKQRAERDDYLESLGTAFDAALRAYADAVVEASLAAAAQPWAPEELREGLVVRHPVHGLGIAREEPWANRYRVSFPGGDLLIDRRSALVP